MSDMFFADADQLGVEFNSLPDTMEADNIQSQSQLDEGGGVPSFDDDVVDDPLQQHPQDASFDDNEDFAPTPTQSRNTVSTPSPGEGGGDQSYVMSNQTTVDGTGMWKSWTRVFDQPRYACLDLLDNCLDATLNPPDFAGKVEMQRLPPNGIVIINNSSKPIKPLKDVLVVYGSTKGVGSNQKADAIGENGVGLKHGCATLSNTSFVLTRNQNVYSMGVIAKTLQSKDGVCLPSFEFVIENPDDKSPTEIETELYNHITNMAAQNPKVGTCISIDLGQGDMQTGIQSLVDHCKVMWNQKWEPYDHVFQVLLTSLVHQHNASTNDDPYASRRAFQGNNPAIMFLNEIKQLLPKFYINIPLRGFEFRVEDEKVQFSYWQHRLVELTKFVVYINKDNPIQDINHMNWMSDGYQLSVYCGFEAQRVAARDEANAAHMYIYSRYSGRLIQIDDDARATLGLPASGSDYQQGLTLIVDDITAQLPLMPTKQGIAWSEQRGGETHKRNLMAWVSGVAHCFWNHHAKTFQSRCERNDYKTLLQNAVQSFADPIKHHLHLLEQAHLNNRQSNNPESLVNRSMAMERLELADFTIFRDNQWKKTQNRNSKKWRITRTFGAYYKPDIHQGDATIFKFTAANYPPPQQRRAPPPPVPPVAMARQMAQIQASAQASAVAAMAKKRKLDGGGASEPISLLDDDSDENGHAGPAPRPSPVVPSAHSRVGRTVARKSAGKSIGGKLTGPAQLQTMQARMGGSTNNQPPPPNHVSPQQSEMRLRAMQAELDKQKRTLLHEQARNRDMVERLQQELQRTRQHNQQLQNVANQQQQQQQQQQQAPPPDYQANLQRAQDELTIVKRQKTKLEGELQDIKDQRATEVSGLNLEIEGLRMKLEQQDETIQRLQRSAQENQKPDEHKSNGFISRGNLLRSKYHGTDSI